MDRNETVKWIWFSECTNPAAHNAIKLLNEETDIEKLYSKEYKADEYRGILETRIIDALSDKDISHAEEIYDRCTEHGIAVVPYVSEMYPPKLREIQNPPSILYCRGKIKNLAGEVLLGCVGTRNATRYGRESAADICAGLAHSGIIIVSGMARGIDAECHTAALNEGKYTVAVLGSGADVIYPQENSGLYDAILKNGMIISEYPPHTEPTRYTFPQRNRIISGISNGVFVLEAPLSSGAMITAGDALYQGKDIFALPGRIGDACSTGTNRLIQNGAKLVTCANDIIVEYQFTGKTELIPVKKSYGKLDKKKACTHKKPQSEKSAEKDDIYKMPLLSDDEKAVLALLSDEPKASESIAQTMSLPQGRATALLMMLQVKGLAKELPGNLYIKILKG